MAIDFDLIYMDETKRDQGQIRDFSFDLAYGSDENDFELTVNANNHVCRESFMVYIEGTEYGGRIDKIRSVTANNQIVYIGRTWHGILEGKVLEPDVGADYLEVSGDANEIIGQMIQRTELGGMFTASRELSGISVSGYKFDRYTKMYTGLKKMLKKYGAKLIVTFKDGLVELSAAPIVDYSRDDEFDSDQVEMVIEKAYRTVNHMICLGAGELKDRDVIHLYIQRDGSVGDTIFYTGLDEITEIFDYPNAESLEELRKGGTDALIEAAGDGELKMDLDATQSYDIGDIVGGKDITTGITVKKAIIKKIVNVKAEKITIQHEIKEE